ncbi:MAG: reverse transcriptase family protein [Methylobacterium sp.]|uniref:reverse transcriptase family protein n=1 Tax=Methylobacterium sp. TaxID=409 RepID=UPI0025E034F3|nr:reverse transcriptase family protein [Methylobacterium sp.]MBX9930037.1 reverse transcriptase family protein [Methylobacterium sp.]
MLTKRPQHYRSLGRCAGIDDVIIERALATAAIQDRVGGRIPTILTLRHLAELAGVPYGFLRGVAARRFPDPYTTFQVRKIARPGEEGYRTITVPPPLLMSVQRWISGNILVHGRPHAASTAYAPGSSVVKAAERHCGCRWLIKLDARRFFESISEIAAYRVFTTDFAFQPLVALELARICTRLPENARTNRARRWLAKVSGYGAILDYHAAQLGHLPQGAPSSPMLANLAVREFDDEMARTAQQHRMTYTRYADDIALSTSDPAFTRSRASDVVLAAYAAMGRHGLSPNTTKTNVVPPGARKLVLGLLVDGDRPRLTREFKDSLRMHFHYCLMPDVGPVAHAEKRNFVSVIGLRHHLGGLVAFASQIEPEYGASLSEQMKKIVWPL